jgi:hypothetical protein
MSSQSLDQIVRFTDNPNTRIITAFFRDGTSIIIDQLSYDNYTNPPGYKIAGGTEEQFKHLIAERKLSYYTALSAQLT